MARIFNSPTMTAKKFAQFQLDKKFMPIKGGLKALKELHPSIFKKANL